MNLLCWLIDHKWLRECFGDDRSGPIYCKRCKANPYSDTTLPDWFRDRRIVPRMKAFAKRVRVWFRSRPCWVNDHTWSAVSQFCIRCGQSGIEVSEAGEWPLPVWKKLWRAWLTDRFYIVKPYLPRPQDQDIYAVQAFTWRFGVERSTVTIGGEKYMTRYIAYLGPLGLRLHQFFRGDDDSASHTHPWAFITFPFATYHERRFKKGVEIPGPHYVRAFRFHYRPSDFEHIVVGRLGGVTKLNEYQWCVDMSPFWTFVITGPKTDDWGFYPKPGQFVYWRDYKPGVRT